MVIYISYKMNTLSMGTPKQASTSVTMYVVSEISLEATAIYLINTIKKKKSLLFFWDIGQSALISLSDVLILEKKKKKKLLVSKTAA